jgi:tetratricopeptide (TPR) repeat protein
VATTVAIIAAIVSVLGALTGVGTVILNWRAQTQAMHNAEVETSASLFERRIANLQEWRKLEEGRPDEAVIAGMLKEARQEYNRDLGRWQDGQTTHPPKVEKTLGSHEKRIAELEKRPAKVEGSSAREQSRRKLVETREEYEENLKAWQQGQRVADYFSIYDKRIAVLRDLGEEAELRDTQKEYEQTLQAWQQTQELAALVPRGAVSPDAPKLPAEQIAQLVALLEGSTRLPATVLTADDYLTRGDAYYEAGDYQQALDAYNRALELRPDDPDTLNNRGNALGKLERHEQALKDYNRALELEPHDPDTLSNHGAALANVGRHEDALKDFNRALELRPDHPDALYNRGLALHRAGHYENAIKDYNRALELTPNHPATLYNRACTYSMWGNFEEALRGLEAAIKGNEKYRKKARTDEDFENLRNDPAYGPRFRELVGQ